MEDTWAGLRMGLIMSFVYCAGATAILMGAGLLFKLGPREYLGLILGYLVAGALGGAIAGALKRFSNSALGLAATGLAVAAPVFLALGTVIWGVPLHWGRQEWGGYAGTVLLLGPTCALLYQSQLRS